LLKFDLVYVKADRVNDGSDEFADGAREVVEHAETGWFQFNAVDNLYLVLSGFVDVPT
jgi:hypothetical protein